MGHKPIVADHGKDLSRGDDHEPEERFIRRWQRQLRGGWTTHTHRSNDPLNPWYSIRNESTGETYKGRGDFNAAVDSLLQPSWRNP
jgi:hypothetical protein